MTVSTAFTSGLGLDAMSLDRPTVVPLTLACSGGLAKSTLSLFRHRDRFFFFFFFFFFFCDTLIELGSHYTNRTF